MDIFLDIIRFIWPWLLSILAVTWSLLSSRLAWWGAGLLAHGIVKRLVLFVVLWGAIMLIRIYIFIGLLCQGVMPWTQIHAWKTFLQLVRCYTVNKASTSFMLFLTIFPKEKDNHKLDEIDIYDILGKGNLEDFSSFNDINEFLTILLNATNADQKYLDGLRSLANSRRSDSKIAKFINWGLEKLSCFNIKEAQQDILSVGKKFAKHFIMFAIENKEATIAVDALLFLQGIVDIEDRRKRGLVISKENVSEVTSMLNKIMMRLYVFCKIHPKESKVGVNESVVSQDDKGGEVFLSTQQMITVENTGNANGDATERRND